MKKLIMLLKGIAIGVANVIPGFSGATMAIVCNIYEEFIYSFANILRHPIKMIKKFYSLYIGVFIGVILALLTVVTLLKTIPFITIMFFIGLVVATIPSIYKKVELKPINVFKILSFIISILIIIVLPFVAPSSHVGIDIKIYELVIIFVMGVISASAMVIPGVSGSMVLMILGYYSLIMTNIKECLKSIFNFEFALKPIVIMLSFGIGIILGIVGVSKLIQRLYSKCPNYVNIVILGLILASPFAILFTTYKEYNNMFNINWYEYLIGVIVLVLTTLSITKLNEIGGKKNAIS